MAIGDIRKKDGTVAHIVEYEVTTGTNFVEYVMCPLEGQSKECPQNSLCIATEAGECVTDVITHNRMYLPTLYSGRILLKMRPCLEPDFCTEKAANCCGEYNSIQYDSQKPKFEIRVTLA